MWQHKLGKNILESNMSHNPSPGIEGRVKVKTPDDQKYPSQFCQKHLDDYTQFRENLMWSDEIYM